MPVGRCSLGWGARSEVKTTVADLAALIGGRIQGDPDAAVLGVGSVDDARPNDVVVATDERFFEKALACPACCVVTRLDVGCDHSAKNIVRTENPAEAFAKVLELFRGEERLPKPGIGPGAIVEPGVTLGEGVAIGANCYVGKEAVIDDGCVLFPNVYIGDGVRIGEKSKIYPGVAIYAGCVIGRRVILHAGTVIGADGFGYTCKGERLHRIPHAGNVEIGDDVEIGANSAIDRAKTGSTVIGDGTKIDNLVHIAHNCKIGRNCVLVALVGVAGSVTIGDNVTLAGQSGVKDHVTIEDGSVVAARAGVVGNLPKGVTVSGFPARDHRLEKRVLAASFHLPEIMQRLKSLEAEVERLRDNREDGK